MEKILLGFGKGSQTLEINKKNLLGCLRPKEINCEVQEEEAIKKALENPIGTTRLNRLIEKESGSDYY